jgi:hypothetical protein
MRLIYFNRGLPHRQRVAITVAHYAVQLLNLLGGTNIIILI